jgi:3-hydroxybutyryl-CoA dehydratase
MQAFGERPLQGLYFDELSVGQSAETTHVVGAADIEAFAAVSGDVNPVHLDEAYAKGTPFGGRIAHGMLGAAFISAVIGNKLPGPGAIYLSQSLRFRRPVRIGDPVTAKVVIKALDTAKGHATLETVCLVNGKTVIDGEALIMVPKRGA